MKIEFKSSFSKDIKKINDKNILLLIYKAINNVESVSNTKEIANIKKLIGYKTYYRIKIKDFRIGLNIENNIVFFVCFLHRKDIYKYFPE